MTRRVEARMLDPDKLLPIVYEEVCRDFPADCCVPSTGTLIDVLKRRYGVKAYPLMVELFIFNPFVTKLIEEHGFPSKEDQGLLKEWTNHEKGWCVSIGAKGQGVCSDGTIGLNGHLVAIAEDSEGQKVLMDPSVPQANRPIRDMNLTPISCAAKEGFLSGEKNAGVIVNGCLHLYKSDPKNEHYKGAPDWRKGRRKDSIRRVLKRLDLETPSHERPGNG